MSKKDILQNKILQFFEQHRNFIYFVAVFCLSVGVTSFLYFRSKTEPPLPPETYQMAQNPSVKGVKQELPLWFPKDIPIIQPETSLLSSSETKESQQVSLETTKGFAETIGFYLDGMKKWGWEQKEIKESAKEQVLAFTQDTRAVEISLSYDPKAEKTVIVISITNLNE